MDFFVDPDGVVVVRNCGCENHGPNALWASHDAEWRGRHRRLVMDAIRDQRGGRHLGPAGRFDAAELAVSPERTTGKTPESGAGS